MIKASRHIVYSKVSYKYKVEKAFWVQLPKELWPKEDIKLPRLILTKAGLLTLLKGYVSDGASGPTIDTDSAFRGPFTHDALYQLFRLGLLDVKYRLVADQLMADLCLEDKMLRIRAYLWKRELRKFGAVNAEPGKVVKTYTAP